MVMPCAWGASMESERPTFPHRNIDQKLREYRQIRRQRLQTGTLPDAGFKNFEGGQHAVASGAIFPEDYVAGLLATERRVPAQHFFEHVFIADGSPNHRNPEPSQSLLKAQVRHHRRDDNVAGKMSILLQALRRDQHDGIAIDYSSRGRDQQRAIGIEYVPSVNCLIPARLPESPAPDRLPAGEREGDPHNIAFTLAHQKIHHPARPSTKRPQVGGETEKLHLESPTEGGQRTRPGAELAIWQCLWAVRFAVLPVFARK
jgi:hypothetical protein